MKQSTHLRSGTGGGSVAYLDIYSSTQWDTFDGQAILPGHLAKLDAYQRVECEVQAGNVLYIPAVELNSTLDSPTNTSARYIAVIRDYRGVIRVMGWPGNLSSWSLTNVASQRWEDIINRNSAQSLSNPAPTYLNQTQTQALIDSALGARNFSSATVVGVTAVTVDPTDPNVPIAVGANDPDYLALLAGGGGGLTAENGFYNVINPAYGIAGDGTTDDTVAFQALIDLVPDGSVIFMPPGLGLQFLISGSGLTLTSRRGIRFTSLNRLFFEDSQLPWFVWGGSGGTTLNFVACYDCTVDGVKFTGSTAGDGFIAIGGNPQGGTISSTELVTDCSFHWTNMPVNNDFVAVYLSKNANQNNELFRVERCTFYGKSAGFVSYNGGAISAASANLTITDGALVAGDEGQRIRIGNAGALVAGRRRSLDTTIVTVTGPTTCVIADAAVATVAGARTMIGDFYGTGIRVDPSQNALHLEFTGNSFTFNDMGIDIQEGSGFIRVVTGAFNNMDVRIRRSLAEGWIVHGLDTENSVQGLFMDSGDHIAPTHVYKLRGGNNNQLTEGWLGLSGQVKISDSTIAYGPPPNGQILYDVNNTTDLLSERNFYAQNGAFGEGGIVRIGFAQMRSFTSFSDLGVSDFGNLTGSRFMQTPSPSGPFTIFSPVDDGGYPIPAIGSVTAPPFASALKALESVTSTGTLVLADGMAEVTGAFRSTIPIVDLIGTHAGGATTYLFSVVSVGNDGARSLRSYPYRIDGVNNTLSASNYITLRWPSVGNAASYEVYLQNPANQEEGWQLAGGVPNLHPDPSVYNLQANPVPGYVAWGGIVPIWQEASIFELHGRTRNTIEITFADGDTTPTVRGGNQFVEANTGATLISALDHALDQQIIDIRFTTANTTIVAGANMRLAGGLDFVGSAFDSLTLKRIGSGGGAYWQEKCRSVNA